jgi:hypothetical protein
MLAQSMTEQEIADTHESSGYAQRKDNEDMIEERRRQENQLKCIQSIDGPLQLTAEPGSGKTLVLALRAL